MIIVRKLFKCKWKWSSSEEMWNAKEEFRIEKEDIGILLSLIV